MRFFVLVPSQLVKLKGSISVILLQVQCTFCFKGQCLVVRLLPNLCCQTYLDYFFLLSLPILSKPAALPCHPHTPLFSEYVARGVEYIKNPLWWVHCIWLAKLFMWKCHQIHIHAQNPQNHQTTEWSTTGLKHANVLHYRTLRLLCMLWNPSGLSLLQSQYRAGRLWHENPQISCTLYVILGYLILHIPRCFPTCM